MTLRPAALALLLASCAHEVPRLRHHQSGAESTLSALRGRAVLLNVWAEWCAPCRAEMPVLLEAARAYGDEVRLVALYDGAEEDSRTQVDAWLHLQPEGWGRHVAWGNAALRARYAPRGVPTTYVLGRNGATVAVLVGAVETPAQRAYLHQAIRYALQEVP